MTKSEFLIIKQTQGTLIAALYANIAGIALATVQLWNLSK
jgi:hypothetical protein